MHYSNGPQYAPVRVCGALIAVSTQWLGDCQGHHWHVKIVDMFPEPMLSLGNMSCVRPNSL